MRRTPLLSPYQQRALLDAARARDRLTNKALAHQLGLTEKQVKDQLRLLRQREFENSLYFELQVSA